MAFLRTSLLSLLCGSMLAPLPAQAQLIKQPVKNAERLVLRHTRLIYSLAFSPDGRVLASACAEENAIALWDAATGKELRRLQAPQFPVTSVAFAPDGKTLASASCNVRLWEVATGKDLDRFAREKGDDYCGIAFGPDGKYFVTGGFDSGVCVWEVATGWRVAEFRGHAGQVRSVQNAVQIVHPPPDFVPFFTRILNPAHLRGREATQEQIPKELGPPDPCANRWHRGQPSTGPRENGVGTSQPHTFR
ncbi:MAG: hypothetical protein L0Z62_03855 [Gemmataceae bacterium]|nr:hypothetical protein [Gemmataceae bacterium]